MSRFTLVALGDSSGVGVGASDGRGYVQRTAARLERLAPGARTVNLCVNGATSGAVLAHQVGRVRALAPSLVTLFVGGNDVWRGVQPPQFSSNVDAILAEVASSGAPVLVGTVANLAYAPAAGIAQHLLGLSASRITARIAAFNDAVRAAAARHGATVVDLAAVGLGDRPDYFCVDGFHPSDEGYAAWTDLLWPFVERFVERSARAHTVGAARAASA